MDTLVIILIAIIWLCIGGFINHKRNWYNSKDTDEKDCFQALTFVFSPIFLIAAIIKGIIIDDWNNG